MFFILLFLAVLCRASFVLTYLNQSSHVYLQSLKMISLATLEHDVDRHAPLSGEALVSLLMEYCNKQIYENTKLERAYTKELINDKIAVAVTALATKIGTTLAKINEVSETQAQKSAELEAKLANLDAIEEKLAEANLKLETYGLYHQNLLANLKSGLHDSLSQVEQDMKFLFITAHTCNICNRYCNSLADLQLHIRNEHSLHSNLPCTICGKTFQSTDHLNLHMLEHKCLSTTNYTDRISLGLFTCERCGKAFQLQSDLQSHLLEHSAHSHTSLAEVTLPHLHFASLCEVCGTTFYNEGALSHHVKSCHKRSTPVTCNLCGKPPQDNYNPTPHCFTGHSSNKCSCDINPIVNESPCTEPERILERRTQTSPISILQLDGNVSPSSLSPTTPQTGSVVSTSDAASHSNITAGNIQFQYSLNSVAQAKRLLENTDRPPFSIRYSNLQNIKGQQHPTNVSIDFNSGVYLSAVKPVLEEIDIGWKTEVLSTIISCDDLSNRSESSGRNVSSKLVLYLAETSNPSTKLKVVIHFYHTSSTVQVQGSSLLSCGINSPVWLVKNFIEPLATKHATNNSATIEAINTNIRQSNPCFCSHCKDPITTTASLPKDQELSCNKCGKHFHKKCTDRKRTTGNWRRSPWFCQQCLVGPQPLPNDQFSEDSPSLNPTAQIFQPQLGPPPQETTSQSISIEQADISQELEASHHNHPLQGFQQVAAQTATDRFRASSQPIPGSSNNNHSNNPVFPTNSVRQRGTNINTDNPEAEFQKTALSACRSTITQQETELKRLKEVVDIRNKRIMQLEAQIGHAADFISARDTETQPEASFAAILSRIETKMSTLMQPTTPTSNNIVINNCKPDSHALTRMCSIGTQTDVIALDTDVDDPDNAMDKGEAVDNSACDEITVPTPQAL